MAIQNQPAPGFSADGLSYSVAQDLPKIIANISAEYEARARNPRYNPFGPSPDAPEQLRREGLKPYDELWTEVAMGGGARQSQAAPKTYEIGNKLVQMDASGKPVEIYSAPTISKDEELELRKKALSARIIGLERDRSNPDAAREFKMAGTTVDKELQKSWDEAAMLLAPKIPKSNQSVQGPLRDESLINGEQLLRQPKGVFRMGETGADWQYDPLQRKNLATNVPSAPRKWVRDSSGKMVEAK